MNLDLDTYLVFLEDIDIARGRKIEMIETVWGLMESHVDQAFGLHSAQNCGYLERHDSQSGHRTLDSKKANPTATFNGVA